MHDPGRGPRRLFVLAALALGVVLCAELAARLLEPALPAADEWPDASTAAKVDQMDARGCADLVVVGNSVARDDVIAADLGEIVGVAAYNAALDAAGPGQQESWLLRQVAPRLDPSTVVWVVTSPDLNDRSPAETAAAAGYERSIGGRDDTLGRVQRTLMTHSALVRDRAALTRPSSLWEAASDRVSGRDASSDPVTDAAALVAPDGHGVSRSELRYEPDDPVVTRFVRDQLLADYTIGGEQLEAAGRLVDELGGQHRGVVIVLPPVTEEFIDLHPGGRATYDAYRDAMVEMTDAHGIILLDLSDAASEDAFADTHHLNGAGAEAFTTTLAETLGDLDLDLARDLPARDMRRLVCIGRGLLVGALATGGLVACSDDGGLSTYADLDHLVTALDDAGFTCELEYDGLEDDDRIVSLCALADPEGTESQATLTIWADPGQIDELVDSGIATELTVYGENWTIDVRDAEVATAAADALGGATG